MRIGDLSIIINEVQPKRGKHFARDQLTALGCELYLRRVEKRQQVAKKTATMLVKMVRDPEKTRDRSRKVEFCNRKCPAPQSDPRPCALERRHSGRKAPSEPRFRRIERAKPLATDSKSRASARIQALRKISRHRNSKKATSRPPIHCEARAKNRTAQSNIPPMRAKVRPGQSKAHPLDANTQSVPPFRRRCHGTRNRSSRLAERLTRSALLALRS